MPSPPAQPDSSPPDCSPLQQLITRPDDQRLREHKFRFAQSVVFGAPVLALQRWGSILGPVDSQRWASVLQALLCGWVMYVNFGMIVEGFVVRRLDVLIDCLIATTALALYAWSVAAVVHVLSRGTLWPQPLLFHACVILLATWTGLQWFRFKFFN